MFGGNLQGHRRIWGLGKETLGLVVAMEWTPIALAPEPGARPQLGSAALDRL